MFKWGQPCSSWRNPCLAFSSSWGLLVFVPWQGEISGEEGWLGFGRSAVTLGSCGNGDHKRVKCILGARFLSTNQEAGFLVSFHTGPTCSITSFLPSAPKTLFGLSYPTGAGRLGRLLQLPEWRDLLNLQSLQPLSLPPPPPPFPFPFSSVNTETNSWLDCLIRT